MAIAVTPRGVGLMLAATLATAWFETASTPSSQPQQSDRAAAARLHQLRSTDTSIPNTDRLRARLSEPPVPARGRNPFVYGSSNATRSAVREDRAAESVEAAVEPPPPALPVFRLSGIASSVENGAPVLTAIVIDNGSMVFVKTGDKLSRGYSVVKVDELSVTLADAQGVTQTIRLP